MDVSSSCLEHLVCDECWNVHLRGREESGGDGGKGGIEGRRRWREGGDGGNEEMEGRRRWREGRDRGEERRGWKQACRLE